ncbi:MAG: outer membrane lipoprotein-sorting protein [Pseudomonadota bacterium]
MERININLSIALSLILALNVLTSASQVFAQEETVTPRDIIQGAMDNFRGESSFTEMTMTIHREDWERSISMQAWTAGDKNSLVRVTKPKKDLGNATLIKDKDMWSFAPKINRVIKVPSSMMNQSWMGSDFSNKDISRSTEILDSHAHTLTATEEQDGHTVYTITAVPHEDAPVVWGKEVLVIRDDFVLLEQQYWDQDGVLVKTMKVTEIAKMDGRNIGKVMRMFKVDEPEEWTQVTNHSVDFDVELAGNTFTLSNLRNAR